MYSPENPDQMSWGNAPQPGPLAWGPYPAQSAHPAAHWGAPPAQPAGFAPASADPQFHASQWGPGGDWGDPDGFRFRRRFPFDKFRKRPFDKFDKFGKAPFDKFGKRRKF